MSPLSIGYSKRFIGLALVGSALFIASGAFLVAVHQDPPGGGWLLMLLGAVGVWAGVRVLRHPTPRLVLDEHGIWHRRLGGVALPWSAVAKVALRRPFGASLLCLELRAPTQYAALNRRDIRLDIGGLALPPKDIAAQARAYLEASRAGAA